MKKFITICLAVLAVALLPQSGFAFGNPFQQLIHKTSAACPQAGTESNACVGDMNLSGVDDGDCFCACMLKAGVVNCPIVGMCNSAVVDGQLREASSNPTGFCTQSKNNGYLPSGISVSECAEEVTYYNKNCPSV